MKCYVLYHETKDLVRLVKTEVKDGMVDVEDKMFDIDKFEPKLIKISGIGGGIYPLYMLKWDSVNPAENFNPIFEKDKEVNPEVLKKTMSLKILGNMLKIKKPISPIIMIMIGVVFGGFVVYFLFASKIIKM